MQFILSKILRCIQETVIEWEEKKIEC